MSDASLLLHPLCDVMHLFCYTPFVMHLFCDTPFSPRSRPIVRRIACHVSRESIAQAARSTPIKHSLKECVGGLRRVISLTAPDTIIRITIKWIGWFIRNRLYDKESPLKTERA